MPEVHVSVGTGLWMLRARTVYFTLQLCLVLALCHHFIVCASQTPFWSSSDCWSSQICCFAFSNPCLTTLRDLHLSRLVLWCALRRGKAACWAAWGTLEVKIHLVHQARCWTKAGTSDRKLCTLCSTASSEGKAASSSSFLPEPAALGGLCHWLQVLCAAGGISSGNRGTEGSFWREFDHKFNIKHKLLFEQAKLERSHRMHSAAPVQSWLILSPKWGWSSGAFVGEHSLLPSRCNLKRSEGEMADVWRAYVQGRSVLFRCPGIFVFWNVFLRSSSHKRKSKALPNNMLFDFTSNL